MKRKLNIILLSVIFLLLFTISIVYAEEGVTNGGFETGSLSPWTTNANGVTSYAEVSESNPHSGTYSCGFFSDLETPIYIEQDATLGDSLVFWKKMAGSDGSKWNVTVLVDSDVVYTEYHATKPGSWYNTWEEKTVDVSGYGGGEHAIRFITSSSAGSIFLDDISSTYTSPPPVAGFSANETSGYSPLAIAFTDSSTGTPTSWNWSFGDGNYSSDQNPVHVYYSAGSYSVSLNATNSGGSDIEAKSAYIIVLSSDPPVANFYADDTAGNYPLNVSFHDTSTNTPTTWEWDFENDGLIDSTDQNPFHVYGSIGYYTVALKSSNPFGNNTKTRTNYIYVGGTYPKPTPLPTLNARFTVSPKYGENYLNVTINDTSYGAAYFREWDFGDGTTDINSTNATVHHNYTSPGKYTVTLHIYNSTLSSIFPMYGAVMVVGNITPIPTTTFSVGATRLVEAQFNVSAYAQVLPTAYTNMFPPDMQTLFMGIVFAFIFMAMFIRFGDMPLLTMFGLITAAIFLPMIPLEWQFVAQGFLFASVASIIYILIKGIFK